MERLFGSAQTWGNKEKASRKTDEGIPMRTRTDPGQANPGREAQWGQRIEDKVSVG